jgi:hypothetical protein
LHFIGSCILIRLFSSQLRWCPASRRQRQNVKLFLREPLASEASKIFKNPLCFRVRHRS